MKHKSSNLKILINDEIIDEKILSVSIGIGKYSGGGMIQTPAAVIDDGFFDVTIYPNMNKRKIFTCIRKLHNGNILTVKEVKSYRTKLMKIYANNKVFAETDGEVIGSGPYEISILPKSINILT